MGIFTRSRDIINSNINAALDRAEDPAKMVRMMIREMDEALSLLKSSCAAKLSERVRIQQELERCDERVKRWSDRAVLAVKEGKDDLAKEALLEKKKAESAKTMMEKDLDHLGRIIDESKVHIQELEGKLDEAVQKQSMLIQRGVHAKETLEVNRSIKQAGSTDTLYRFNEMEKRIERMEAEAELSGTGRASTNEKAFHDLEMEKTIDEELQALKSAGKAAAKK